MNEIPCNHTSVGMIVRKGDDILLIERQKFPFGFACPAGHVDEGESFKEAAVRELREEVGLETSALELVFEGDINNPCRRKDGTRHHWQVFDVSSTGELQRSTGETRSFLWASSEKLEQLRKRTEDYLHGNVSEQEWKENPGLEPVWLQFLIK